MLSSARHGEGASRAPRRCIRVPERCARRVRDGERWLRELCVSLVSLGGPIPTPSEPEVPKSRCWRCPGRCCRGQGAGMDRAGWGGMEGLQRRKPIPIHIPFPFPVPSLVPVPSLLPLPSATCLPAVPSVSPPCLLIVPPDVRGSTGPNEGIRCNYLRSPFLLPSLMLPGSHRLAGKSAAPCDPLGTGQDQTSIPLPRCLPSALSPRRGRTQWSGSCRARLPSPPRRYRSPSPAAAWPAAHA